MSSLDLPSDEELRDWSRQRTAELEKSVARQTEEIHELRQANYDLRVELARIIQYIDDHAPRADDALESPALEENHITGRFVDLAGTRVAVEVYRLNGQEVVTLDDVQDALSKAHEGRVV